MNAREFYDYILANYNLHGTSARLIDNILQYIAAQGFVDAADQHNHLTMLLGDAFGLTKKDIKKCHFS